MSGVSAMECLVAHWAERRPEGVALRTDAGEITWTEWHRRITVIEQQLVEADVGQGARVGLCLPTSVELLSLLIALFRRGAVACPVNPQFPVAYREKLLARLDCALVVDGDGGLDTKLEESRPGRGITPPAPPSSCGGSSTARGTSGPIPLSKSKQASRSGHDSPPFRATSTVENPPAVEDPPQEDGGAVENPPACGGAVENPPACGGAGGVNPAGEGTVRASQSHVPTWHLDQPATIIFTSGSTGEPKAAVLSLRNHLESARASNANIPLGMEDTWLLSLPLHHVAGFGVLFRCLLAGATISIPVPGAPLQPHFDSVTHVSLVARQLAQLLDANAPLNHCKAILLGGSAIPAPLIDRAFDAGLPIHTSYGMTETATQIAATPPGATRVQLASSGRPLAPDTIRIADDGRIQVKGLARFLGYWDGNAISSPFDEAGWFITSDCGHFDDEGFLHILGRADNVFIAGGENIQPEEIERALCALPGVTQAIVVPVSHPEFGATPVAFVGSDGALNEDVLRAALLKVLPRFKVPHHFLPWPSEIADSGMKPSRAALAEKAATQLGCL